MAKEYHGLVSDVLPSIRIVPEVSVVLTHAITVKTGKSPIEGVVTFTMSFEPSKLNALPLMLSFVKDGPISWITF